VGDVLVNDELVEVLGQDTIDAAIGQSRLGDGYCPAWEAQMYHVEEVSLVVH
jgi:hypothetical protein